MVQLDLDSLSISIFIPNWFGFSFAKNSMPSSMRERSTPLVLVSTLFLVSTIFLLKKKKIFSSEHAISFQISPPPKILFHDPQPTFPSKSIPSQPPPTTMPRCQVGRSESLEPRYVLSVLEFMDSNWFWGGKKKCYWFRDREIGFDGKALLFERFDGKLIILSKMVKCAH